VYKRQGQAIAAAQAVDQTAPVSLKNGGGNRLAIGQQDDGVPERTFREASSLSSNQVGQVAALGIEKPRRFDDCLAMFDLTHEQLRIALGHAVDATEDGATPGRLGQVGGFALSFDPTATTQALGARGAPSTPGERMKTLALIDAAGATTTKIVRHGALNPQAPAFMRGATPDIVALFGGDCRPFRRIQPDRRAWNLRANMCRRTYRRPASWARSRR